MELFGQLVQRQTIIAGLDTVRGQGACTFEFSFILTGIQIQSQVPKALQIKLATSSFADLRQ